MKNIYAELQIILPFILFFSSYYFCSEYLYREKETPAPSLIGQTLHQASKNNNHFSFKILENLLNNNYPDGTIIFQYPKEGTHMRKHECIYIKTTHQNQNETAPLIQGMSKEDALAIFQEKSIPIKIYPYVCDYPEGYVYAQGVEIHNKNKDTKTTPLLYLSKKERSSSYIIFSLTGTSCKKVQAFLEPYGIKISCFEEKNSVPLLKEHDLAIISQNPLQGSYVHSGSTICLWH